MPVLALVGPKGGAGKTTLALAFAALAAAEDGQAVALDLDPNAALSMGLLGGSLPGSLDVDLTKRRGLTVEAVPTVPGLLLAPGDISPDWDHDPDTVEALAAVVKKYQGGRGRYWIVLDTPPSWGRLVGASLLLADVVVLVVDVAGAYGRAGLGEHLELLEAARQRRGRGMRFAGILPNRAGRTRASRRALEALQVAYKTLPPIRAAAPMAEAAERGSVFQCPPHPVQDDIRTAWQAIQRR